MLSREELEQIIDRESSDAEGGCSRAQALVISAMIELDDLDMRELAMRRNQESE